MTTSLTATPDLWYAMAGVFMATATAAGALAWFLLDQQAPWRKRLASLGNSPAMAGALPLEAMLLDTAQEQSRAPRFVPKSPKDMRLLRRRLANAGYHGLGLATVFAVAEIVTPIVFGCVPLLLLGARRGLLLAVIAAVIGFLVPGLVLDHLVRRRQRQIRNGLPDALDLLVVCVEAGNGIDQAIVKAGDELTVSYPALSEELRLITIETRAGKSRLEAFKNFSARTKVDDVQSLVAMLVQTDRFGTSVAQALRTYADVLRTKRRQRAEERAAKLGVKLVFPLVFFLFPALYVVTLGPAVVQYVRVFKANVPQK
jgi:tight adherence protein C